MSDLSIKYKNNEIATLSSSGTKTIKTKGKYCEDDITVIYDKPEQEVFTTEEKTVTPSESVQEVTPTSADGLSKVTVEAISSSYVGSVIPRNPILTSNGATVSVPRGYYTEDTSKNVASGSLGTVTATKGTVSNNSISITPSISGGTVGYISETSKTGDSVTVSASELVSGNLSLSPSEDAQSGIDVTNIATVSISAISNTYVGTGVTRIDETTITPTESEQVAVSSNTYTTGDVKIGAISNTYVGSGITRKSATTISPTESVQTAVASGVYTIGDVNIGAISTTYVGSGITRRTSSDLTASGATVTVPAGYYASQASKSVASGTAGTPSVSKGTIRNNQITITPSVTNTTGYITGGTKTGTAITVNASDLVSGTLTLTANGTSDCTNYKSVTVNVPAYDGSVS